MADTEELSDEGCTGRPHFGAGLRLGDFGARELKAPLLAHQLLKHNKPFALLLPTDLLEMVPKRADGVVDAEVRSRLQIVRVSTSVAWGWCGLFPV